MNTSTTTPLFRFVAVIISISAVFALSSTALAAQSEQCNSGIESLAERQNGYAAPFSVDSGDALLTVDDCEGSVVAVSAGNDANTTFIHKNGYVWNGSEWEKFLFTSDDGARGDWFTGAARGAIAVDGNPWIVAYICEQNGTQWTCGDGTNKWMLQRVERVSVDIHEEVEAEQTIVDTKRAAETTDEQWLLGYYQTEDWGIQEPFDIPYENLTHLAIGDVKLVSWGIDVDFQIPNANIRGLWPSKELEKAIADAKEADVVPLVMFGGGEAYTDSWREQLAGEKLYQASYGFNYEFDFYGHEGMAINWTGLTDADIDDIIRLIEALREEKPEAVFTFAVPLVAEDETINPKYLEIEKVVDRITIMQHEDVDTTLARDEVSHYSALFTTDDSPISIESSVAAYNNAGIPLRKLNVEAPLHGQCWEGVEREGDDVTDASKIAGIVSLWDVINEFATSQSEKWAALAGVEYITIEDDVDEITDCNFISYLDREGAVTRADWVKENGLGGITAWDLSGEYIRNLEKSGYLTEVLARALND